MCTDPYKDFAERYDAFHGEFGQHGAEQVEFWKTLFPEGKGQRLLDCACGTGNDLQLLHRLGHWVCGSDVSTAMLRQAKRNLAGCHLRLPLVRADFRKLPYPDGAFVAVLCLTTSLPHLLERREVAVALRSMWRVLRTDGVLVLSQGLTDKLMREQPRFIPEINTVDLSRILALDYLDERVRINVLDVIHEQQRQALKVDSFEYLTLLPADYRRLLPEAGYSAVEFYSGYAREPYDPHTSDRLVVVARK